MRQAIEQAKQQIWVYSNIQKMLRQQNGNKLWGSNAEKKFLELVSKKATLRLWLERAEHIYRIESNSNSKEIPSDPNDGVFLCWAA